MSFIFLSLIQTISLMRKSHLIFAALFFNTLLFSQKDFTSINGVKIESYSNITKLPLMVSITESKNLSIDKFSEWLRTEFLSNTEVSFSLVKNEKDQLGLNHARFQQNYKGVKIESSMIIAHCNNNIVKSFNGDWFTNISISNSTSLSEEQALQFALNKVNAKKYKWENEAEETHMKQALKNPDFTYKPKGELIVFPVIDTKQKTVNFLYAYKFNIYAEKPLYRANVYVDASTGKIVKEQNLICTIDVPATANTKYSGTQTITTDNYTSGVYRLRETGRGNGIETYDLANNTFYTNTDFTNTSTSWTNTGFDQSATDAHWGAEKTYDYYNTTFARNSIDANGYALLSYVHYDVDFVNAFWDGERMTYGDGDISQGFTEMTGLDVCGHEITHGLVQFTAQLGGGEADALNEAFADIFGTNVEWYARPSQHDWIMGKEIMTSNLGFRDMSNPNSLQQPDTYLGNFWDQSDEPHMNNGPCIYWYYLLSVGGSGTNDNSQNYTVTGISMAKASAIAYRALSLYMTPNTDYTNVRECTIQAAKDLYGACSNEAKQTTNAWYAVGVGAQYVAGTILPDFSASQTLACTVPATVNFTNLTNNGSAYKWYFGDGITSTTSNPVHTYTANGIYSVKLVATACSGGSKDSTLKTNYINVNISNPCIYTMPNTTTNYSVCSGTLYDDGGLTSNYSDNSNKQITITTNPGGTIALNFTDFSMENTYDFIYIYKGISTSAINLIGSYTGNNLPNNGLPISTNTNVITVVQSSDMYLNESGFELHWTCSTVASGIENLTNDSNGIMIYPNPSQSVITLDNIKDVKSIEITNALGQVQKLIDMNGENSITIITSNLSDGIYFVKLHTNERVITKKIVKQ
jgi:Zn-dependent metalloprotease